MVHFWCTFRRYFGGSPDPYSEADIVAHVTAAYPPSFIADGNVGTFPDQARMFADRLKALGVEHEVDLPPMTDAELGHGYMESASRWTDRYNAKKLTFLEEFVR